jgi:Uma2 family endonuclease
MQGSIMSTIGRSVTAEALFEMGDIGRCELIGGRIVRKALAEAEHGEAAVEIACIVKSHVDANRLGKVFLGGTGFVIARNPDTVGAPDVAFVGKDRLPSGRVRGFFPGAPDLAVEVVSPSDRLSDLTSKVDERLAAGATSVWVLDPPNRAIVVYRAGKQVLRYGDSDELRDEPTLPGFALKLSDLFVPE